MTRLPDEVVLTSYKVTAELKVKGTETALMVTTRFVSVMDSEGQTFKLYTEVEPSSAVTVNVLIMHDEGAGIEICEK